MPEVPVKQILKQLGSDEQEAGWARFLEEYSPLIFQVVRHFERDDDRALDCFQFVCQQLVKDRFRRLRRFDPDGPASFSTWLRAVVRNLCLDNRRKEFGRLRIFRSVSKLSVFDQEVFRHIYERGNSVEETVLLLAPSFPDLRPSHVGESVERINKELTANQRWRLSARMRLMPSKTEAAPKEADKSRLELQQDPRPDPETQAVLQEERTALRRVLNRLSKRERLLVRLRFEEELTLEQIARLLDLGNAQRADRQVKDILARLRKEMGSAGTVCGGKNPDSSVKAFGKNAAQNDGGERSKKSSE